MSVSKEWVHLRSFLRQTYNDEVRKYFRWTDKSTLPGNDTGKNSAIRACLITPTDSLALMQLKVETFRYTVQRVHLGPPIFSVPAETAEDKVKGTPRVILYFSQDEASTPLGTPPLTAEIGFRVLNETFATMTPLKATEIAKRIKQEFIVAGKGITWNKGKVKCLYDDSSHKVDMRILALNAEEGMTIIKKLLECRGGTPFINDCFSAVNPNKASLNNPTQTQTVYGKRKKVRRWRPTGKVRFRYATMQIQGLPTPVTLVDATGSRWEALVR